MATSHCKVRPILKPALKDWLFKKDTFAACDGRVVNAPLAVRIRLAPETETDT